MPSSYSVIRRYTPPTCTLEILAKKPLFPWQRFSTEELRFELRFDDPKLPHEKQVVVYGDRAELKHLYEVVTHYIQDFLWQPPSLPLHPAQNRQTDAGELTESGGTVATLTSPLQAKSLLAHALFLEPLAVEASGKMVKLSTLQLFDLAEALEGSIQTITSPQLYRDQGRKTALVWAGAAAIVLAGLPIGFELLNSRAEDDEQVTLQEIETQPTQPPVQLIPPVPTAPTEVPESPTLPTPLASEERLPPPPPVDVPSSSSLPAPPKVTILPAPAPNSSQTTIPNQPVSPPTTTPVIPRQPAPPQPSTSAQNPGTPKLSELPALQSQPSDLNVTPEGTAVAKAPESAQVNSPEPAQNPAAESKTASSNVPNRIPQLAEVEAYFQKEWQPPASLEETLEYRLVLNRDGSIKRIVPLGQAARVYLDRTNMPLMGETFVSPLSASEAPPQIRVFLHPNGTVKTFLES